MCIRDRDKLIDFFDSDVVANDELLTKYLAKNKKAVLGEIIATIQKAVSYTHLWAGPDRVTMITPVLLIGIRPCRLHR